MAKLEILRSEGKNLGGIFRRFVLLPVARINSYEPADPLVVLDTDFDLDGDFEPSLVILESTNKTGEINMKTETSGAGTRYLYDMNLLLPGDERFSAQKLAQVEALRYFVVFARDFNTTESDKRWKVYGNKEEPMVFSFSHTSDPKRFSVKLQGGVENFAPWYDPEANPEEDLD